MSIEVKYAALLQTIQNMQKRQNKQQFTPQVMTCLQQNQRRWFHTMLHQLHLNYFWKFQTVILEKFTRDLGFLQSILKVVMQELLILVIEVLVWS